jgi:hypothetical protein
LNPRVRRAFWPWVFTEHYVRFSHVVACAVALAAMAAAAQVVVPNGTAVTQTGPGWGVTSTTTMANARVLAVDAATRQMDVELADGRVVGLSVGPEVRRLAEIRAGDVVNVAFTEALVLELRKAGAPVVARSEGTDVRRAASNLPPAGVAQKETTVLADVLSVDAASSSVVLRGPEGIVTLRLRDPAQVGLVRAGDQVQATYVQAIAVSVDAAR